MSIYRASTLLMSSRMASLISWKEAPEAARLTMNTNWPGSGTGIDSRKDSLTRLLSLFRTVALPSLAGTLTPILTPLGSGKKYRTSNLLETDRPSAYTLRYEGAAILPDATEQPHFRDGNATV